MSPTRTEVFEAQRGRLLGLAYGMLGSAMDAEDVVQNAYLRWTATDTGALDSPASFLTTMVTRLAIDELRSARHRRERYVGPWLPEPVLADDPGVEIEHAQDLQLALLATLERLNPVERAVLILRDVFDFDYGEIAPIVDRSIVNCRQIASRARTRVGAVQRRHDVTPEQELALVHAFGSAVQSGDLASLITLLAEDAILWTDGGEAVPAARNPIHGADRIARYFVGVAAKLPAGSLAAPARVNGEPGWRVDLPAGAYAVGALEPRDGVIGAVRVVLNPAKLRHLNAPRRDGTSLAELLPGATSSSRATIEIAAPPEAVWQALHETTLRECRVTTTLLAMRSLPAMLSGRGPRRARLPGADLPLLAAMTSTRFAVLHRDPERAVLILGIVGQLWKPAGGVAVELAFEGRRAFQEFGQPGYVKSAISFAAEPTLTGTRLVTETRNQPTDTRAERAFRRYWRLVRWGSHATRVDLLRAVRRRAERTQRRR